MYVIVSVTCARNVNNHKHTGMGELCENGCAEICISVWGGFDIVSVSLSTLSTTIFNRNNLLLFFPSLLRKGALKKKNFQGGSVI